MLLIFSTLVFIRHLWQFKTVVFLHWCLIRALPLTSFLCFVAQWFSMQLLFVRLRVPLGTKRKWLRIKMIVSIFVASKIKKLKQNRITWFLRTTDIDSHEYKSQKNKTLFQKIRLIFFKFCSYLFSIVLFEKHSVDLILKFGRYFHFLWLKIEPSEDL